MKRPTVSILTSLSLLATLAGLALPVRAQGDVDRTLDRIAQTGTISLGHREASVPFSYYDARRQVVGYSHELMLRVLDTVKAELKLPALTIKLVPVTAQNRIPLLQNGTVDLECGSTTHNVAREREVAFSHSIFVIGTRLMVPRGSRVRDFADLGGKRVVVTAGTTSERLLRTYAEQRGLALTIEATKDHDASFRRLEAGAADAYMMDDALLHGVRARALRPDDWEVVGQPMSTEVYACAMRRGDAEFKRVVDAGLARLMLTGEALRIYQRWFQRPIPPRGLNLAWPPSDALLALYRSPNDRPRD
ncbi:transporter substrate-binding domain-containing protein [Sphaerotilus mobilis]|nr:transporter substrate-binding domain-containing protein [Sphaerotilus mobilis]